MSPGHDHRHRDPSRVAGAEQSERQFRGVRIALGLLRRIDFDGQFHHGRNPRRGHERERGGASGRQAAGAGIANIFTTISGQISNGAAIGIQSTTMQFFHAVAQLHGNDSAIDCPKNRPTAAALSGSRAAWPDAELYLNQHEDRLVILDEIHRLPGLFEILRGLIDRRRRKGRRNRHFLLLGSASLDLMRQSAETLAGRAAYEELTPLSFTEAAKSGKRAGDRSWVRGGFPDSFLATSNESSFR